MGNKRLTIAKMRKHKKKMRREQRRKRRELAKAKLREKAHKAKEEEYTKSQEEESEKLAAMKKAEEDAKAKTREQHVKQIKFQKVHASALAAAAAKQEKQAEEQSKKYSRLSEETDKHKAAQKKKHDEALAQYQLETDEIAAKNKAQNDELSKELASVHEKMEEHKEEAAERKLEAEEALQREKETKKRLDLEGHKLALKTQSKILKAHFDTEDAEKKLFAAVSSGNSDAIEASVDGLVMQGKVTKAVAMKAEEMARDNVDKSLSKAQIYAEKKMQQAAHNADMAGQDEQQKKADEELAKWQGRLMSLGVHVASPSLPHYLTDATGHAGAAMSTGSSEGLSSHVDAYQKELEKTSPAFKIHYETEAANAALMDKIRDSNQTEVKQHVHEMYAHVAKVAKAAEDMAKGTETTVQQTIAAAQDSADAQLQRAEKKISGLRQEHADDALAEAEKPQASQL